MKKIKVGTGILLPIHTDKFKTELLTVTQSSPFDRESLGLCSLLHSVQKRGCRAYPTTADINRRLDDLYDANINLGCSSSGDNFTSNVTVETLCRNFIPDGTDVLDGALRAAAQMLRDPLTDGNGLFRQEYVDGEKLSRIDRFRAGNSDPKARSSFICQDLMFEGERYGQRTFQSEAEIEAVTNKRLADFYGRSLTLSAPLYIYVGPRSDEEICELLHRNFDFMRGTGEIRSNTLIRSFEGDIRFGRESMAVNQGKLTVGLRSDVRMDEPDFYAALIFNDIFGGSPASKLFRNVRERLSLCYSCGSAYDFTKGVIFVRSGIANENYDRAVSEILRQLDDIKQGKISDFEFESARKALVSGYRQVTDSAYATEGFYKTRLLCGCEADMEETAQRLQKVTLSDVVRVSRRFNPAAVGFVQGELEGEEVDFDEE